MLVTENCMDVKRHADWNGHGNVGFSVYNFFFCFEIAPQSCLPNTDNSANSNLRKKEDEVGRPIHVFPRVSFSLLSAVV
jgi:hypothetical protein